MKFSHCGRLLATAGQDNVVRIWVLKSAFDYFNNMRQKYNTEGEEEEEEEYYFTLNAQEESYISIFPSSPGRVSPSPSQESLCSSKSDDHGVSGLNLLFFFFCIFRKYDTLFY